MSAFQGVYSKMKFEPFVQQEYPKMLYLGPDKVQKLVSSQHEELIALGSIPEGTAAPNPLVVENQSLQAQVTAMQEQMAQLLKSVGAGQAVKPLVPSVKVNVTDIPQPAASQGERALELAGAGAGSTTMTAKNDATGVTGGVVGQLGLGAQK